MADSYASRDALVEIAIRIHDRLGLEGRPGVRKCIRDNIELRFKMLLEPVRQEALRTEAITNQWKAYLADPENAPKPEILPDAVPPIAWPLCTPGGYKLPCWYTLVALVHDVFVDDIREETGDVVQLIVPEAVRHVGPRDGDEPLTDRARILFADHKKLVADGLCRERLARTALQEVCRDLEHQGFIPPESGKTGGDHSGKTTDSQLSPDIDALAEVLQELSADYSHSGIRLVVIEGDNFRPELIQAATGHRGLSITTVGILEPERTIAAILSHGRMDKEGLEHLERLASRAGAWLTAIGYARNFSSGCSADSIWWTVVHRQFAERNKREIDGRTVWVHDPLLHSLEALASIRSELAAPVNPSTSKGETDGQNLTQTLDGPCHPYTWCHNGQRLPDNSLQRATWNLLMWLWNKQDRSATFDELAEPVFGDHELIPDDTQVGKQRTLAKQFFEAHSIPWKVRVTKIDRRVWLQHKSS